MRLDTMTHDRIESLERDKRDLQAEVARLQELVDRLAPQCARLEESLSNAEANNVLATILIGGGGFLVSYSTFTGNLAPALANFSAGLLMAGILMMFWHWLRRWRRI